MVSDDKVFNILKDGLIAYKPKTTDLSVDGEGFNDSNVMDVEVGALPETLTFDYVYVAPPIGNYSGLTIGSQVGVQRAVETHTIDLYCRRDDANNIRMKRETLKALKENTQIINNMFANQGFTIYVPYTDLDYGGNGTARRVINITKVNITK